MSSCPTCHVFKGLWSPLVENKEGMFVCQNDGLHKFKRDGDGNFHSIKE